MDFFLAKEKTDSIEHLLSHTQLLCFPFKLKIYFLFRKLLFFLLTGSTLMKCVSLLTIYCKKWWNISIISPFVFGNKNIILIL